MAELLLELLSEEIPARMQKRATEDLQRLVGDGLKAAGLNFTKAQAFATPRRLALVVEGLPDKQPDQREEKKGPRVGSPDQALQGFLKGAGLASIDQAEKRATDKGEFYFAVAEKKGRASAEVLPAVLLAAMAALPWPKSMKWGDGALQWVRPLQSVLALFNGKPLVGEVKLGGAMAAVPFGNNTVGHRFHAPGKIAVKDFADYAAKLKAASVILDPAERKRLILEKSQALAAKEGLTLKDDAGLLDEVAGLVEWPVPLLGSIDAQFMELPAEVLVTSMRAHQKYFALTDKAGKLAPRFVVVANSETKDGGKQVVAGNERVLRARLSDAKFFWDQDRNRTLEEWALKLKDVTFQAKLGTMARKRSRIRMLAAAIAEEITKSDLELAWDAGDLCKADLVTGMVGEFPELQGVMGGHYAGQEKLAEEISLAIAEHYAPAGPNDMCPSEPTSVAVALADKIDTIAAFWWIGAKPTGSRDPYALRRAALGIIRLILENELRLPLRYWLSMSMTVISAQESATQVFEEIQNLEKALDRLAINKSNKREIVDRAVANGKLTASDDEASKEIELKTNDLLSFFADRLKVQAREQGARHDVIDAVFALGGEDDLVRLMARVDALQKFLGSDNGKNLLVAYGRAANIVAAEQKKDKKDYNGAVDEKLLQQAEEKAVVTALAQAKPQAEAAIAQEDFVGAMTALSGLRAPLDAFFDKVTVNADDKALRANRLNLLTAIRGTMNAVADFSKIEG